MGEMEFPPGTPDEVKEYVKKQYDQYEMSSSVARHAMVRFFEELNKDQVVQLHNLLAAMVDDPSRATYFLGYLTAYVHKEHNICGGCGLDHAEQMEQLMKKDNDDNDPPTEPDIKDYDC